jgi:hypothetical protein
MGEELGRWATDDHLFIYFDSGLVLKQCRRSTITTQFQMTREELEITRDYYKGGAR